MSRRVVAVSLFGVLAGLAAVGVLATRAAVTPLPGPNVETLLYDGDLTADSGGINVAFWGSGSAESTHDVQYLGPDVLKVKSEGPYQGIVLQLKRAADLAPYLGLKDAFVDLRIRPAQYKRTKEEWEERVSGGTDRNTRAGRGGAAGGRGGARGGGGRGGGGMRGGGGGGRGGGGMRGGGGRGGGGGMRGGGRRGAAPAPRPSSLADAGQATPQLEYTQMRGGGMRGGGGRGGGGGARGGGGMRGGGGARGGMRGGGGARGGQAGGRSGSRAGGRSAASNAPKEIGFTAHFMRIVLFTDKGEAVAEAVPISEEWKDPTGWYRVSYPLSRFSGIEGATRVQAVSVSTDEADTFFLGQVRLAVDREPVKLSIKGDPAITTTGKVIEFELDCAGGYLDPKVSWDFDETDGIQKQAAGTKVKYFYTKPGDYMVTATVEDRAGVQTPLQKQFGVHVEQGVEQPKPERATTTPPTAGLEGTKKSDETITIERGGSLQAK